MVPLRSNGVVFKAVHGLTRWKCAARCCWRPAHPIGGRSVLRGDRRMQLSQDEAQPLGMRRPAPVCDHGTPSNSANRLADAIWWRGGGLRCRGDRRRSHRCVPAGAQRGADRGTVRQLRRGGTQEPSAGVFRQSRSRCTKCRGRENRGLAWRGPQFSPCRGAPFAHRRAVRAHSRGPNAGGQIGDIPARIEIDFAQQHHTSSLTAPISPRPPCRCQARG